MSGEQAQKTLQYETLPTEGTQRFWLSIYTWLEDWPDDVPFHFWQTGTGSRYIAKPSKLDTPIGRELAERLKESGESVGSILRSITPRKDGELYGRYLDRICAADEEYAVSDATLCMLVDSVDEDGAYALVAQFFPDMERRFCEPKPTMTLTELAKNGRFEHPHPVDTDRQPSVPSI